MTKKQRNTNLDLLRIVSMLALACFDKVLNGSK